MSLGVTFQNEVRIRLSVNKSNLSLFHIILRYVNPGTEGVSGRITVYPSLAKSGRYNVKPCYLFPSLETESHNESRVTLPPSAGGTRN